MHKSYTLNILLKGKHMVLGPQQVLQVYFEIYYPEKYFTYVKNFLKETFFRKCDVKKKGNYNIRLLR